jgi:hypothetical protein
MRLSTELDRIGVTAEPCGDEEEDVEALDTLIFRARLRMALSLSAPSISLIASFSAILSEVTAGVLRVESVSKTVVDGVMTSF